MQESEESKVVEGTYENIDGNNFVVSKELYESFVKKLAEMYDEYNLSYPQIMEIITNHILSLSGFMVSKSDLKESCVLTHFKRALISEDKTNIIVCDINIDLQILDPNAEAPSAEEAESVNEG